MALGILEAAANVRQYRAEVEAICSQLRDAGGDWIPYKIAAEDAMKIADDGLRNCWCMLDRIKQLALDQQKRSAA
jgi:hypothetical protein